MHAESVVAAMLAGLSGAVVALDQAPTGSVYPLVVYSITSNRPLSGICGPASAWQARVQINPVAGGPAAVNALHDAVRAEMETYQERAVGAHTVLSCVLDGSGPWDKTDASATNTLALWTKPVDWILTYR